jgi:hypothetical protein
MQGDERRRLEQWAREQRRAAGEQVAFEVAESGDPLRDDALHLTFGWPLWLFTEVQHCIRTLDQMSRDHSILRTARILGEIPVSQDHSIRPLDAHWSELLFAYAVVLGAVQPVRVDCVMFDRNHFPHESDATSLTDAMERFTRSGMNRTFKKYLSAEQANPAQFQQRVQQRLSEIDGRLNGVPDAVRPVLGRLRDAVERDLANIVVL